MRTDRSASPASCLLLFEPLWQGGRRFAFPCDPQGLVDLDALGERARTHYLHARAMIGRELGFPRVHAEACAHDGGPHR